ncbi:transposase family protein [Streptomyces klenkii]|uniref:transposase family protein n=1 Tax=Streptomyces klenkii TaxID=1420899 RepID=UPI0030CA7EBF
MPATLVLLRHCTTHDMLACWFDVDRSTITRAIGEVRPLLADRCCTIAPGIRLRTLADMVDHLDASRRTAILNATEIRARLPAQGSPDRDRFISGKSKQNAVKATVLTDAADRLLFCGETRPGSCPDNTQARPSGLIGLLGTGSRVEILADAGYQELGRADR